MALRCSPVARLPIEIMHAIFNAGPDHVESRMYFAMSVSQVSRLWRQIALRTPFIWSSVLLYAQSTEEWWELMKMRIKLSCSHPLDIMVELYHYGPKPGPEFYSMLDYQLNVIIPEASRWKSLQYSGSLSRDAFSFFQTLSLLSAPLLEVLEIEAGMDDEMYINEALIVFSGGAPILSRVMIEGIKISSCLPPISSVYSFALYHPPGPIDFVLFKEILTTPDALTNIELHADVVDEVQLLELAADGQYLELSSLRSLFIAADMAPENQLLGLLSILRCPGLETMSVAVPKDDLYIRPRHNYKFPTYASLRSLQLDGLDCIQLCADFDVKNLPALTCITFIRCSNAVALLRAMVPTAEVQMDIWPLLQSIGLDAASLHRDDVDELCTVLSYRNQCGRPINCVRFDIAGDQFVANGNHVGALQKHVHIEIYCVSPDTHSIAAVFH